MNSEHPERGRDPRFLFSCVLLLLTLAGFVFCLFYARPSTAFILASLIPAALALVTHVYRLYRPSQPLDILVIVWLVLGIGVVKAWIPNVGSWETWLFYCFALALISASTVVVLVRQQRRLHDDVA
ncbi:MAG: hypothetical protein IH623_15825 [Verrucomicrobia bacterium]|nr:hypothetical protein [Verrucomicrobiota bacterium]